MNSTVDPQSLSLEAQAVMNQRLTYLSAEKMQRLEATARQVLDAGVMGNILEFGVALGGSAIVLSRIAQTNNRHFHGFDLFGLIPEPASDQDDKKSKQRYRVIASGKSRGIDGDLYYGYRKDLFKDVCDAFNRHGMPVDGSNVTLHKGLFQDTWNSYQGGAVAFAHLDCDWYEPVKFCLASLVASIPVGGGIVLDDYNDYQGCRTATNEFVAAHPDFTFDAGANAILRRT